jgi:hypothetical protein
VCLDVRVDSYENGFLCKVRVDRVLVVVHRERNEAVRSCFVAEI